MRDSKAEEVTRLDGTELFEKDMFGSFTFIFYSGDAPDPRIQRVPGLVREANSFRPRTSL